MSIRRRSVLSLVLLMICLTMQGAYAVELPDEALQMLAEAAADPCSICAEQMRKKALRILDEGLRPGQVMCSNAQCRLKKSEAAGANDVLLACSPQGSGLMPTVVFTFHTPQGRLVGIADSDLTDKVVAEIYHASMPGTVFDGRLRLIPYRYGDGAVFNYFQQTNRLQVHCIILELKPVVPAPASDGDR